MSGGDGDVNATPAERKAKEVLWENVGKMRDMPGKPVEMKIAVPDGKTLKEQKAKIGWIPKELLQLTREDIDAMSNEDKKALTEDGLGVFKVLHDDGDVEYFSKKDLQDNIYTLEKARYGERN